VIDPREYVVQDEVVPSAVVERHRLAARRGSRTMRTGNLLHPVLARRRDAPRGAELLQTPPPRRPDRKDNGDGKAGCDKDRRDEEVQGRGLNR
jgi:hypothetical protein